jgi:hypothetical protein
LSVDHSSQTQRYGAGSSYQLLWKPQDVPSAQTLDVLDNNLKAAEVHSGDCVESNIQKNQGPLEESVDGVCTRHTVNLVLDEEVHKRHKCRKESSAQVFSQFDGTRIRRTQCETSQCPRQSCDQVADHEDVVPVVVIRACNICPSSAGQCPENSHSCDEFWQAGIWSVGHAIEEEDQQEAWTGANGDEDLEDRALRVAIANGCADGGEPFDGVSKVFVLDNLGVMEGHADDQGAEEGRIGGDGVEVGDPLARYLQGVSLLVAAVVD